MKITFLKNKNKKLTEFNNREWKLIHPVHYGEKLNKSDWIVKHIRIKAEDKGKIIGGLIGNVVAGIFYLDELIIDNNQRGLDIGRKILKTAEIEATRKGAHMAYLFTGDNWEAIKFYEKLGYKKITFIKKFFSKKDFWLMTKYL